MKAIKRTIASLLASLMLLSSVNVSFAAETYTDDEAVVVAKVNAAGIMTGTDNGFEPSKTLTRAEAAAIMVRMKGIPEAQVKSAAGTTLFGDVSASHWAAGYINVASSLGIIKGVGANEFAPDRTVTIAEMTTMAVRALGAGQLVDAQAGTWPTNYMNFAGEEKLTDGVFNVYTAEASRLNAATIVANTLEAPIWEKSQVTTNNEVTWAKQSAVKHSDGTITAAKTILSETLEINVYEEVVCTDVSTKDNEFNNKECLDNVDLTNVKKGLLYDYWTNEDGDILGVWETESNDLKKISFSEIVDVNSDKNEITFLVNGDEKTYDYDDSNINKANTSEDSTLALLLNEVEKTEANLFAAVETQKVGESIFGTAYIDGSDVTAIYAEMYTNAGIVEEVTSTKIKFDADAELTCGATEETTLKIDTEDNEYFITKDGKSAKFDDIEEGDAIFFYEVTENNDKKYVIAASTAKVEGEVTAVGKDYIKLDGKKYEVSKEKNMPKSEDEIVAYFNKAGKVVMYKEVESAAADVAIVKYLREVEDKYGKHNTEIELFLTDGTTTETLTLDLEATADEFIDAETDGTWEGVTDASSKSNKENAVRDYFAIDEHAGTTNGLVKGAVVCYEMSGDKVTIVPADSEEPEFVAIAANGKLDVGTKLTTITDDNAKYYLDSNTKVFNMKTDDEYEVKVEEVSVDSLDDTDPVAGYVASIDEDDNTVKYVFFSEGTTISRTSATNFAYIENIADTKYDGEKALEVDVVFVDGSKETYIYSEDEADCNKTTVTNAEGKLVDLTVSDNLLIDVDVLADKTDDSVRDEDTLEQNTVNKYLAKVYSRGTIELTAGSKDSNGDYIVTDTYELADDEELLVLEYVEDDEKYIVRSIDDIEEYDEDADKHYVITEIATYLEDDEDDAKVVLVIYEEVDTTKLTVATLAITTAGVDPVTEVKAIAEYVSTAEDYAADKTAVTDNNYDYSYDAENYKIIATQKTASAVAVDTALTISGKTFTVKTAGVVATSGTKAEGTIVLSDDAILENGAEIVIDGTIWVVTTATPSSAQDTYTVQQKTAATKSAQSATAPSKTVVVYAE